VSFIEGSARDQVSLLPPCIDDYVAPDALVRVVDVFVSSLNLAELGFVRTVAAATGRPGYHPGDMLRLYIWGYLNQVRSSRHLERACVRDLEALWLLRQIAPDYRTVAAFRHDNPEAIVAASAAFIQFCRETGLVSGRLVALDGTKMRAVASPKNFAGADRLARDVAHTEKEIAYYLDRLVWRRKVPHTRPQSGKGGGSALNPRLQHAPRGERLRRGATDASAVRRASLCWTAADWACEF
jgi:transposase